MPVDKQPFTSYTLDEDKGPGRVFTVRMNEKELAWMEEIKEDLNVKADSKALKMAAFIGKNVLQSLLGRKMLQYLFKKEREKLEDHKNF